MLEEVRSRNKMQLKKRWNDCIDLDKKIHYDDIYKVRTVKEHLEKLVGLFLPLNHEKGGLCLDAGCGTGNMFEFIARKIRPTRVDAVDWAKKLLKNAKKKAEKLQQVTKTDFKLNNYDLSEPLPWPDNHFDVCVSNLVIYTISGGWKNPVKELIRVIKPGAYLYIGTLLEKWSFKRVLRHAPIEIIRDPKGSIHGLKYLDFFAKFHKELKEKHGTQYPKRQELLKFLKKLNLREIKTATTYWGGGLVLRGRKLNFNIPN